MEASEMTEKFNDGGPAFPICQWQGDYHAGHMLGLSMRDYFAASVIQALSGNDDGPYFGTVEKPVNPWPWLAEQAYAAADAMLAKRGVPTKETA